jgi:hypothetical protein
MIDDPPTKHRYPHSAVASKKGVHGVAGQAAERDCAHVGEDLDHLGLAVILAQFSIDSGSNWSRFSA